MKNFHNFPFFTIMLGLLIIFITLGGCNTAEVIPTLVPAKTLPPTWTIEPTSEATLIPTETATWTPSPTAEPKNNWWVVSLNPNQNLRVNFAAETSDGGILVWAEVRNRARDVSGDVLIKLNKYGLAEWGKRISPAQARVQLTQILEDGTIYLSGFHQEMDFYHPFYIQLSEDGLILSSEIYQGISQGTNRYYFRAPAAGSSGQLGQLNVKGELPGDHYVSDYAVFPDGSLVVMGPIHGPITSDGATFSYLRGFYALLFDEENRIVWQRFFQTKPTGPFFEGLILPDGSIIITQDQNDYLTILKLNQDGFPAFWRHYSSIISIQSISATEDSSTIITAARTDLVKLDGQGDVIWSKELAMDDDQFWIQYVMETESGDLVLFLGSAEGGLLVSRVNIQQSLADCPLFQFSEKVLVEHFPYPPTNISGSIRVTTSPYDLVEWMTQLRFEDLMVSIEDVCRYQDPE